MTRSKKVLRAVFLAHALAVVHTEMVLIHPFREGNGRLARILAIVMAVQAGLPSLDFGHLQGRKKHEYFLAVRTGMKYDYGLMEEIFTGVIERSLKRRGFGQGIYEETISQVFFRLYS